MSIRHMSVTAADGLYQAENNLLSVSNALYADYTAPMKVYLLYVLKGYQ